MQPRCAIVVRLKPLHTRIVASLRGQGGEERQDEAEGGVTEAEDHPDVNRIDHAHVGRELPQHADDNEKSDIENNATFPL